MKSEFAADNKGCADTEGTDTMGSPCTDAADEASCATHGTSTEGSQCCEWKYEGGDEGVWDGTYPAGSCGSHAWGKDQDG
jgi:hypothetical protein